MATKYKKAAVAENINTDHILWMADCYSLAKKFPNPSTWLALLDPVNASVHTESEPAPDQTKPSKARDRRAAMRRNGDTDALSEEQVRALKTLSRLEQACVGSSAGSQNIVGASPPDATGGEDRSHQINRINPFHYWLWMEIWNAAQTTGDE